MKNVIDLDKLAGGVDYWRNPEYKPQTFGSRDGFFGMLKKMQEDGNVCAYSKEAEQNMPEIVRWFKMNGIDNIPIVYTKDESMVEVWDDKVMMVDPESGEFIITQKLSDNQIKKTTYAPVQIEVANMGSIPEGFQDITKDAGASGLRKVLSKKARSDLDQLLGTEIDDINQDLLTGAVKKAIANSVIKPESEELRDVANYLTYIQNVKEQRQVLSDTLKKRIRDMLELLRETKFPAKKSETFRQNLLVFVNKTPLTGEDNPDIADLEKEMALTIKPFADNKKAALKELARLNVINSEMTVAGVEGPAIKKIISTIEDIQKSASNDYVNVPDKIDIWKEVVKPPAPKVSAGEKVLSTEKAKQEIAKQKIEDFNALSADERLVKIISKTVDPDVLKVINPDEMASGIIDDIISRPYQRDFFKKIKTATELQTAKEAVTKIDGIISSAGIQKAVGEKLHRIVFMQYIKGGETLAAEAVKKLGAQPDLDAVLDTALQGKEATGLPDVAQSQKDTALGVIDRQLKAIEDLAVEIAGFDTTIEKATPEQVAKAKQLIGLKKGNFKVLTQTLNRMKTIPGQDKTSFFHELGSKITHIKSQGFSDLERAIILKDRKEKELIKQKEKGSTKQLGRKTASELQEIEARKQRGELTPEEEVQVLGSEFGITGALAKNISSLYSSQDILQGKPFGDNPKYINGSSLNRNALLGKLSALGVRVFQKERQQLINQVNASSAAPEIKRQLLLTIENDTSEGLRNSINALNRALSRG